jgi:hypothetical protein
LHPTKSLFIFAIIRLPGTARLSFKASSTLADFARDVCLSI